MKSVPALSTQTLTAAASHLDAVNALLADVATPPTPSARRHTARSAKGTESTAALLVALGRQYDVRIPGIDLAAIQGQLALASAVQLLETKVRVLLGVLNDTALTARASSWKQLTAVYSTLVRASVDDPKLQQELAPAIAFFGTRGRKSAARGTTKGASSGEPTAAAKPAFSG